MERMFSNGEKVHQGHAWTTPGRLEFSHKTYTIRTWTCLGKSRQAESSQKLTPLKKERPHCDRLLLATQVTNRDLEEE